MSRILVTSGPTRQYLDPVRYLTNASSGRMGLALAEAMLELGHEVIVVSGPVEVSYPAAAEVVNVISTEEMLSACQGIFCNSPIFCPRLGLGRDCLDGGMASATEFCQSERR